MTMLIAWCLFPVVMATLCLGCGLLLARAAAFEAPPALVLPLGFVVVSLASQFAVLSDATAELATPLVVALAVLGLGLSIGRRIRWPGAGWPVVVGVVVFAVFAAPTVLSGRPTFDGYIKLDDTATYLAMLDRAIQHGYSVAALAPSTYEATLKTSLAYGYPLGSLLPLGVGRTLVGTDAAWLWQPYVTFLAVLIGLTLYELAGTIVRSRPLRALAAILGSQAALIYGYALWGGIKELSTTLLVVLAALLATPQLSTRGRAAFRIPLAATTAALAGVLSVGGAAWLPVPLLGALVLLIASGGARAAARVVPAFVAATVVFAIPAIVAAYTWLPHAGGYRSGDEYGNLVRKLSVLQVFGIWPHGDFRTPPSNLDVWYPAIAVVGLAAIGALVLAWQRRAWPLILAVAAAACACAVYVLGASPWIGGKALASSSPIVLGVAVAGLAAFFELGKRVEAVVAAAFVLAGVVWSNVLQYHAVFLAPQGRLAELETIGHRFAGRGPTLMTQFESYGARHFLRDMTPEAASELRRHYVYLRNGSVADTGVSPDVDEIRLDQVLFYPTLVVPTSGVASRPPSAYNLVWSGRFYQVWEHSTTVSPILEHLSLGDRLQPAAVPSCSEVLRLAGEAANAGGLVAAVPRQKAVVIEGDGRHGPPRSYGSYGENPDSVYLDKATIIDARFVAPSSTRYRVWVGGSFRTRVSAAVDGKAVGSARDQLNWPGNFVPLGSVGLARGAHTFQLTYGGPDLSPGSAGAPPFGLGPFVLAPGTEDQQVVYVQPSNARSLCGRTLDWVEALRG